MAGFIETTLNRRSAFRDQTAGEGRTRQSQLSSYRDATKTRPPRHLARPRRQPQPLIAKPTAVSHRPAQKTLQKRASEHLRINHRSPLRPAQTTLQRQPTVSPRTGRQKQRNDVRHQNQKKRAPLTRPSMTHTGDLDARFDTRE
jgi:hypothetical protein